MNKPKGKGNNNHHSINPNPSYVIGIGASAGGLNPIKQLIRNLPDHIGECAVIVAQHVSPNYKNRLVELIGRETKIAVKEAKKGMLVEPNTIYTTPSDNNITIENGKFVLSKPLKTAAKPSIALLFESIAHAYKEKSAGIVLSGTGKDGAQGIMAIKKKGGITLVQEPSSAKYKNMPQSAIDTGQVDFVLPPGIIGSELLHILADPNSNQLEHPDDIEQLSISFMDRMQDKLTLNERNALFQELQERNKELSEINAYLENFVHVIAHDMRAPVANLKYLADVFTSLDADGQAKYVSLISKSINKLDNTLNGLVQIIDIKERHTTKKSELVDISEVVEEVLEEQQDIIKETGAKIHIKNNYPGKINYIRAYLESILRNLLNNALKYRKKNQHPEIYLNILPQGDFVCISVKDNGIGINLDKHVKNLFTPFSRFKEDTSGLGIGLHIIKTMVENNGGSITVESEEDKGTTFNVFLKEFYQG